ncbi:MAG: ribosomal protein methyltransferase [Clostridiaceae bacterium]|jgi:ribosomal protein L11 methyltransferase|nr:ribosomal protein methyltransferase [Clostridiaceae bacterium]
MYEISIKYPMSAIDEAVEKLQIADIYNVYYNAPIVVTTTDYGYGYYEKKDDITELKIVVDGNNEAQCSKQIDKIKNILKVQDLTVNKITDKNFDTHFDAIDLNNGWIIADPTYDAGNKNKIHFISQGAFGTGLHETTQDCLRYILKEDFSHKNVLDIGTGSGILSLAAAIKGAEEVTALDIRDVREEINYNASLNNLNNINVIIGNALTGEIKFHKKYHTVIINIGGEETKMFLDFIDKVIENNGILLVSGLVTWSFNEIVNAVSKHNYKLLNSVTTKEWCTAIFRK